MHGADDRRYAALQAAPIQAPQPVSGPLSRSDFGQGAGLEAGECCPCKEACPQLEFRSCAEVLAENERLKAENADLRGIFDVAIEAFKQKEAEIQKLKEQIEVRERKLREALQRPFARNIQSEEQADLSASLAQAESSPQCDGNDQQRERKNRGAPKGHRGATRKKPDREPDRTVFVAPEQCPNCRSHNVSRCEQLKEHTQEDIVIVRPVITRFVKQRGYCRDCGTIFFPTAKEERPKGHIGPVAVAAAGFLRYVVKMPFEAVRKILGGLWGVEITAQAVVGFEKKLAEVGRPLYEKIGDILRYSTEINVDETTWPVGILTEWLWGFVNTIVAFFKIDPSRAGAVPQAVLGENFAGVLGSDCFSAYNTIKAKAKQKCLTHYEQAAKELEKFYPQDKLSLSFASSLRDIFKRARQQKRDWLAGKLCDAEAAQRAEAFQKELEQLVAAELENPDAEKLRKRLRTHRDQNFTFLRYKHVEPDNSRAERALRPSVVMRKITYGNNSETGARNHETLMSLVETGKLHGADLLDIMLSLAANTDLAKIEAMLFGRSSEQNRGLPAAMASFQSPQPQPAPI